jgi:lipid-A-disaccharide synthase
MTPHDRTRIFIAAGEPSGDAHAARLMEAIRARVPDVVFEGIGGHDMEMQGLRNLANINDLAVSGFVEVAKRYGYFRALMNRCEDVLRKGRHALFLPIDYPGFNMRLAARARPLGIRTCWYIAPQLWAWGKGRAKELARVVDRLMVVFPFETEFFGAFGMKTVHVGHPLLDDPVFATTTDHASRTVALFPGSRAHEVHRHVPLLAAMMRERSVDLGSVQWVVARSRTTSVEDLQPLVDLGASITDDPRGLMRTAGAGLIKAGTSTLEAALSALPFSTFYRTSTISYHLGRTLVNIDSITLMNLLLKRNVVHEYIQRTATPAALAAEVATLLHDEARRAELITASHEVRTLLGGPGAAARAADVVVEELEKGRRLR